LLNAASIDSEIARLDIRERQELEPLARLTRFALSEEGRRPATCGHPDQTNSIKWHDSMIGDDMRSRARSFLEGGNAIAVRVPLSVKHKDGPPAESHFDVFLVREPEYDGGRPVFVREGIIVSEAKGRKARGFRSIVVCAHKPLADLLGDAENPAHTEWSADSANIKGKYKYGLSYIAFVRESVRNIVSVLEQDAEETAPDLMVDFFSLPEEPDPSKATRPAPNSRKPGTEPPISVVFPTPKPRRYTLTKVRGGFTITAGAAGSQIPAQIEISVAYDVRRGDAFAKYDPADFCSLVMGLEKHSTYVD
jgi:hypothetical protein